MFAEIEKDINDRLSAQPDSRFASDDEVRIGWLVCEVASLREKIENATKRLSMPPKKIRGDGFRELMAELRASVGGGRRNRG